MIDKNKNNKSRKENIEDYLKKVFEKKESKKSNLKESNNPAPAEPTIKPGTKPAPTTRPLKVPKKWPGTMPSPRPKAESPNQSSPAPAEPTIKPGTKPIPTTRPLKVPKKWPGTMPSPRPKAKMPIKTLSEDSIKSFIKLIALYEEKERMKKLMINEDMPMKFDRDNSERPNPHFKQGIEGGESPFKNIDIFKDRDGDQSTLEKIGSEEFNDVSKKVKDSGGKAGMGDIMSSMMQLMQTESRYIPQLEQLALSIVKQKMGLPDEIMEMLEAKLRPSEDIEDSDFDSPEEEVEDETEEEFTAEELNIIKQHVDKRVISNALMMGAGYRAHSSYKDVETQLNAIDRKIYPLYAKIWPSIELYLWQMVFNAGGGRVNLGKSEIKIERNEEEQEQEDQNQENQNQEEEANVKGSAQARLFVVLLHELSKVAVELLMAQHMIDVFNTHGEKIHKAIMKQSDSYEEEQWMKLIGPRLWKYLHDAIDFVVRERGNDYTIVSYVINRMALMEPQEFAVFMKNVLHNGQVAISQINNMIDNIESDIESYENRNNQQPTPEQLDGDGSENIENIGTDMDDEIKKLYNDAKSKEKKSTVDLNNLASLSVEELNVALNSALDVEDYGTAVKIRDEITKKNKK